MAGGWGRTLRARAGHDGPMPHVWGMADKSAEPALTESALLLTNSPRLHRLRQAKLGKGE